MIFVLIGIFIILQKNFDLVVHLWPDIVTEQARNNGQDTKAQTAQGGCPQPYNIRLNECCTSCFCDFGRYPWENNG
jgi:hypothetical protein